MGSPRPGVPCSVLSLLLLLLLPTLLSAGSPPDPSLHTDEDFGSYHHLQGSEARQHWHHSQKESECWGAFDLYFILDKSGSVDNNWIYIYSFVEDLVARFKNPSLRMSFIVFSQDAKVIMPLTADRDKIRKGLNRFQWVAPGGYTFMQEGFKKANEQIMRSRFGGRKVASIIIALTDGTLMKDPFKETKEEADRARSMGAIVYTVGVLDYDKDQMVAVADSPEHMFGVDSGFKGLQDIVDSLASKSCLEVTSVESSSLCVGEPYTVIFTGQGFHNAKGPDQVICRFNFRGTSIFDGKPTSVEDASITCPGPRIDQEGEELSVELSLNNGVSFLGNKFNITSTDCVKTRKLPANIMPYLKFLPTLLLIPLLSYCSWWLWRRRRAKKIPPPLPEPEAPKKEPPRAGRRVKEPQEEKSPPPPPPPPPLPPQPPVSTSPTVIVSCCGCRAGATEGNLDSCGNYIYPSCHQMPLMWYQPRTKGRYNNIALMNPPCAQASCGQKICLQPSEKCCHLTEPPCASRFCAQPSRECFLVPQATCTPRVCLQPSRQCFSIPENFPLQVSTQCHHLPASRSEGPSRMLPLLSPSVRKSTDSLGHSHPTAQPHKAQKIHD